MKKHSKASFMALAILEWTAAIAIMLLALYGLMFVKSKFLELALAILYFAAIFLWCYVFSKQCERFSRSNMPAGVGTQEFNADYIENCFRNLVSFLNDNGFTERAEKVEYVLEQKTYEKLTVWHPTNEKKKIDIVFEYGEIMVLYSEEETLFPYLDDTFTEFNDALPAVKDILRNTVIMLEDTEKGKTFLRIDINLDELVFSAKETEFLKDPSLKYDCWSGILGEKERLFAIGSVLTNMPQIFELRRKSHPEFYGLSHGEEVVWEGTQSKRASLLFQLKILSCVLLGWAVLWLPLLFGAWKAYLFFGIGIPLVALAIAFPFLLKQGKLSVKYTLTNHRVIIDYQGMTVRYSYNDILKTKITYALYERDKKSGTVRVKVKDKWFTALNHHLYSIDEPEKVYEIIEENRKKCAQGVQNAD